MGRMIGIDLGTTNCCACALEGGIPTVIPTRQGSRLLPSIVAFTDDGKILVGEIAQRQAANNPTQTILGIKRLIGRKFASPEVQKAQSVLPYEVVEAANGDARIRIHGKEYSPSEISAVVLSNLKQMAEEHLMGSTGGFSLIPSPLSFPAIFKPANLW